MRVWVDLANSPHVALLEPVVRRLRGEGCSVLLTARDHAQTAELAGRLWPDVLVIGGESPHGRIAKGAAIGSRAWALALLARRDRADVAFSHGSYAQIVAARAAGIPAVTMMDYEFQPANHLSFRLARRVIVPAVFPESALRRFGAAPRKVIRYEGFKEQLYLGAFEPDPGVLDDLRLDRNRVIAVFRPPPEGALYHRHANERFEWALELARAAEGVQIVLLPRTAAQRARYAALEKVHIPQRAIDGPSLLALADLVVGAGGTMNRESALLGTPTFTVFAGRLAAVDAELIRRGRMHDLRDQMTIPQFEKKAPSIESPAVRAAESILETVVRTIRASAQRFRAPSRLARRSE